VPRKSETLSDTLPTRPENASDEISLPSSPVDPLSEAHKDIIETDALAAFLPPKKNEDTVQSSETDIPVNSDRPPEATLVEVVPAPPPTQVPNTEEEHSIPDWLKPLPKATQTPEIQEEKLSEPPPEETTVSTDVSSVISDPSEKDRNSEN